MNIDRQELRDYLLGRMPENLASDLDTRLFSGDELLHRLQEEQDLLSEDFVYGRLSPEDENAFQIRCRQSPSLQEQVNSFRTFLSALERQTDPAPVAKTLNWSRILILLSPAPAALLCVTTFLYLREHRRSTEMNSHLVALSHLPVPASQAGEARPLAFVAFLSANVPRDSSLPPMITIPATASLLELQIELHSPAAEDADWDAELLRGDELIWKSTHLRSHRAGQEAWLSLLLDPKPIRSGSYTIRFFPSADPGSILSRPFRITN